MVMSFHSCPADFEHLTLQTVKNFNYKARTAAAPAINKAAAPPLILEAAPWKGLGLVIAEVDGVALG